MKYYQLQNIGLVKISKHKNAKKIKISINQRGEIKVSIPYLFSYKNTIAFVNQKKDWIEQSLVKVKASKQSQLFELNKEYQSLFFSFTVKKEAVKSWKLIYGNNKYMLVIPAETNFEHTKVQEQVEKIFINCLRKDAKSFLPKRVDELAQQHGFSYNKVFVKNQKTRWGSCSGKKNINLNLNLLRLPRELIDFIILHELCHTREMNHSHKFYCELDKVCPNHRKLNSLIKSFNVRKY